MFGGFRRAGHCAAMTSRQAGFNGRERRACGGLRGESSQSAMLAG
jgi:hypothetical protein